MTPRRLTMTIAGLVAAAALTTAIFRDGPPPPHATAPAALAARVTAALDAVALAEDRAAIAAATRAALTATQDRGARSEAAARLRIAAGTPPRPLEAGWIAAHGTVPATPPAPSLPPRD